RDTMRLEGGKLVEHVKNEFKRLRYVNGPASLCDSAPDFLQYLLDLPEARTCHITLIVCGVRERFLESLIKSIENDGGAQVDGPHPLLANTIDLIARSQNIELVFCPGLAHLRAYLGTFGSKRRHDKEKRCDEKLELNSHDMLAVLDPLSFHKEKLDFSAQEISKTLSLMVQLAYNEGLTLVLCQCEGIRDGEEFMEGQDVWN
ncbi:hypothetical protein KEM55_008645, partial [Ascosphaera atra]